MYPLVKLKGIICIYNKRLTGGVPPFKECRCHGELACHPAVATIYKLRSMTLFCLTSGFRIKPPLVQYGADQLVLYRTKMLMKVINHNLGPRPCDRQFLFQSECGWKEQEAQFVRNVCSGLEPPS